jgi:hypothetical protein
MRTRFSQMVAALAATLLPLSLQAQQLIIYPAKGQSSQQQQRDEGHCHSWAKQSTGIDPVAVGQAAQGPAVGGGERVRGAMRGAVVGEVLGDHGGEGAVIGAMAGGSRARRNKAARTDSTLATYNRAVAACMESRGYTVK